MRWKRPASRWSRPTSASTSSSSPSIGRRTSSRRRFTFRPQQIAEILSKPAGERLPVERETLARFARRALRQKFAEADVGISGANFAIAETGSIVLVTNEGNGRLTCALPKCHIAIMGMEKVIPRLADLPYFLKVLARAATGQKLSIYTQLITGPRRAGELDGPEEFHLVILDNGRSRILGSPLRESLFCIRCGACLNACPIYRSVGGHAYGGVYAGPIGAVLTPLYDGLAANHHLPHASSLCGACQAACPVKIQIPEMLIRLREQLHDEPEQKSRLEALAYWLWAGIAAAAVAVSPFDLAGDAHDRPLQARQPVDSPAAGQARRLDAEARLSRAGGGAVSRLVEARRGER